MKILWRARLGTGLGAAVIVGSSLFPVYMITVESLKTVREEVHGTPLIVWHPTLKWYLGLFDAARWLQGEPFARPYPAAAWFANSAIVYGASLAVILLSSLMAAYALGRLRPPGWRAWRRLLFVTLLIPQTVTFLPMEHLAFRLHLEDSVFGLLLVYPMLAGPFSIWILTAHFQRFPPEFEDAAHLEGASPLWTFWRIILPMSRLPITAAGVYGLAAVSSDLIFASSMLPNPHGQTLAAGLGAMDLSMDDLLVVAGANFTALIVVPAIAVFSTGYVRGLAAALLPRP